MTKLTAKESILVAIANATRQAKELKEAMRHLERIFKKRNRTQRDVDIHDQMTRRIRCYGLNVPEEWRNFVW